MSSDSDSTQQRYDVTFRVEWDKNGNYHLIPEKVCLSEQELFEQVEDYLNETPIKK